MKAALGFLCLLTSLCLANVSDFNADQKVNIQDFCVFSNAWQSQSGSACYNGLCDLAEPQNQVIDVNDLLVFMDHWLWHVIRLDIYSDGWGHYCQTISLEEEGLWTIQFQDSIEPYYPDHPQYYAYTERKNFFTEIIPIEAVQIGIPMPGNPNYKYIAEIEADLDPIDPNRFNGTIFLTQPFFKDAYLADAEVTVIHPEYLWPITSFITDSQGRFSIVLEEGNYLFAFYEGSQEHMEEALVSGSYQDFLYPAFNIMFKPNIYLYPETTVELTVALEFPFGGGVIASEPEYAGGWQITVEPNGLIDGVFEYLFYESLQPDHGQYQAGWVVARDDLEVFFRSNLTQTGFIQKEIDDFIEYWIPLLNTSPYYAIYPQYNEQLDAMVRLTFSQPPDNLIRLVYSIRGISSDSLVLPLPQIPAFSRNGFTAAEWGVILN